MSDSQPQVNEPAARTPEGELKSQTPPEQKPSGSPEPEIKPETKPDIKPEGEAKPEVKAGAPEKYEDFKLPEGIKLEGETLTAAQELFKGLGLTQDAAQSLVDFHTKQMTEAANAPVNAYNEMRDGWKAAAQADPDIGPKSAAIKENIGRAFDTLGDPKLVADFKEAMNLTGVGDHPAFIKVLNKWATQVTEGRNVRAGGPSEHGQNDKGQTTRPNVAQGMYPNLKP